MPEYMRIHVLKLGIRVINMGSFSAIRHNSVDLAQGYTLIAFFITLYQKTRFTAPYVEFDSL